MIRLFQFRDLTGIEAYVLAADEESAAALFSLHSRVLSGDEDAQLWREIGLEHVPEDERLLVKQALELDRPGAVVRDDVRGWIFITPVGEH